MFITPPSKITMKTRNTLRKEQEKRETTVTQVDQSKATTSAAQDVEEKVQPDKTILLEAGSVKSEMPLRSQMLKPIEPTFRKSLSKRSSTSSFEARRKKIELEAAEAKARIEMQLIDKRLEADLAELEEEYSPQLSVTDKQSDVARWVERSQTELESQHATKQVQTSGMLCPPANMDAGTDGPIQQLACVLKDMMTTSACNHNNNNNLLSRISTPKDLPLFAGDSMEWLQFKMAYEESTRLCQFSDSENLWRLRKCLRGAAKDAVQALLITATSPEILMSTLELQFGNPDGILSRIKQEIKKLNPVSSEYHKDIIVFSNKIKNYVAAVLALGRENHLEDSSLITVVLSKLPTILLSKWADYSYLQKPHNTASTTTRLDQLSDFLNQEAIKISQCSVSLINTPKDNYRRKYTDNSATHSQTILVQSQQSYSKCRYCHGPNHNLPDCKKFKKSLRKDRWSYVKRFGLCYKCLLRHPDRQMCPAPVCDIDNCGLAHHRLLHYVPSERQYENNNSAVQVTEIETESNSQVVAHMNSSSKVLLKVVPVDIHGPRGVIRTSCLLDDGSSVTVISANLAERVGLRGRRECMRVRGAWDNTELVCDSYLVDLALSNRDGHMFTIKARSVNELNLPSQSMNLVNCDNFMHLQRLKNDLCCEQLKPEILIGQDNYHLLLPLEVVTGNPQEPCATRSPLGWCLHGRAPAHMTSSVHAPQSHSTLFICDNDVSDEVTDNKRLLQDLHEEVRWSFTFDSLGIASKPRENQNDVCALEKLEKTAKLVDGRWYVGLPWKNEDNVMPDSFPHALSRLKAVERKMEKCEGYKDRYNDRVQHLFDNDYAQELHDTEESSKTWYLPHFRVDNKNKKRLRLVFDCAAQTNGLSLNDYLLKGPDLLRSLFGIMLRFREQRIGITGDIKDMFLRVKIREEDRDALRFLYRNDPKGPVKTYVMSSLIFGATCSPFVAQYIKNKNAKRFEGRMMPACEAIYNQHYVDDYIDSVPDENTAIELTKNIKSIHQQGGFELRNWTSNSKQVLESMPKETLGEAAVKFKIGEQYESERTLGLIWFPHEDALGFDVSFKKIPENIINGTQRPTKRDMLRVVMSIFDVYGFLSPFTINGKIILQQCWQQNIDWNDQIPDTIYEKWCKWISCLKSLHNIRLPRYYYNAANMRVNEPDSNPAAATSSQRDEAHAPMRLLTSSPPVPPPSAACYSNLQLHTFCDSSSKAMCAVSYWRWEHNGQVNIAFVASKCRVSPNKMQTIPRLELTAAIIAARLADTIIKEHKIKAERKIFWCDSSTTLHWIRNKSRTYKPYIANRLGEIDELTCSDEWRYIPTHLNVADVGTREAYDVSILQNQWLHGPLFLYDDECTWPKDFLQPAINDIELECISIVQTVNDNNLPVPEPTRFSSWMRLLRSTYTFLKFIKKCRKNTGDVNHETMEEAERLLIRYSQAQTFNDEISILKNGKYIQRYSKLLTLSPYLDEHGVLRVGGRIDAATDVSPETKRPVILDGRDYITRLIVKSYHVSAAHENQETVVNNLKQKYWIIKLRPTVKNVASKCMICRLKKSRPEIPRMGNLPEARMAHHQRPYNYCGLDLFGPYEVTIGRRREKRYGVIFTCLTVRSIHLETVASLTTDSLIMALRRMAARRGWPKHIFSDNGTNLRGADVELKRAIQELKNDEELHNTAINRGTRWTFIPAASPHWGGAWERLIKSVKSSLKVVLKERAPREEAFNTFLAEVENIVNSRPLTHVSVEPGSQESLTPNHFLLGSSSNLPQMGIFDDSEFFLRKQWRIAQMLADSYWKRWVREVLPDMLPRQKWNKEQRPLQVGDLVFVVDPDGPRNIWPRGIVEQTLPGKDGRTRMVKIRTKTGVLTRSAGRVARIPIGEECC